MDYGGQSMDNNGKGTRQLSEAEQRRLDRFEKIAEDMKRQGYTRRDLTIGIGKANRFAIILMIALLAVGFGLYYVVNRRLDLSSTNPLILLAVLIVLIVLHELIHGVCWSIFTPHHFKDIEFGIMKPSMTPYCACLVPLKKPHHIFGTVMPLVVLGIIPMIVGIAIGNSGVLFIGIVMSASAAGDILIIKNLLAYKSSAREVVYMDHPTEAGGVVFER